MLLIQDDSPFNVILSPDSFCRDEESPATDRWVLNEFGIIQKVTFSGLRMTDKEGKLTMRLQPCATRRQLEQQREQRAFGESQQQQRG